MHRKQIADMERRQEEAKVEGDKAYEERLRNALDEAEQAR